MLYDILNSLQNFHEEAPKPKYISHCEQVTFREKNITIAKMTLVINIF